MMLLFNYGAPKMKIYVGCCGLPERLQKYSKKFKIVELNSTFYKLPKLKTAKKWREQAPRDFMFTVKCHQGITHPITSPTWRRSGIKDLEILKYKVGFLKPTKEVFEFWNQTLEVCRILNSPVCLIQLAASFKENEENIKNVEKFFSKIKRNDISIALELRGWCKEGFKTICKKFDLISCVDPFVSEPVWFSRKKVAYFRLHGSYEKGKINYKYKYTDKDIRVLKEKIKRLPKLEDCFILFNNIFMKEDALRFIKLLRK